MLPCVPTSRLCHRILRTLLNTAIHVTRRTCEAAWPGRPRRGPWCRVTRLCARPGVCRLRAARVHTGGCTRAVTGAGAAPRGCHCQSAAVAAHSDSPRARHSGVSRGDCGLNCSARAHRWRGSPARQQLHVHVACVHLTRDILHCIPRAGPRPGRERKPDTLAANAERTGTLISVS